MKLIDHIVFFISFMVAVMFIPVLVVLILISAITGKRSMGGE